MNRIIPNAVLCRSLIRKSLGLMFSGKRTLVFVYEKDSLVPLHMLFVFFPIDVYYLDRDRTVIEAKKNFIPFTFHTPRKKARYVVEIPSPTNIEVGDTVSFK